MKNMLEITKEEWLNAAHGSRNELKEKFKEALKKLKTKIKLLQ